MSWLKTILAWACLALAYGISLRRKDYTQHPPQYRPSLSSQQPADVARSRPVDIFLGPARAHARFLASNLSHRILYRLHMNPTTSASRVLEAIDIRFV